MVVMGDSAIFVAAALVLGAILGSFLNALSFRFGTGVSIARGRSRCMRCSHTLVALDLVPILSYLFLRGRCRYCGTHISIQYPLVEAVAALLSLGVYLLNPNPLLYAFWLLVWLTILFIVIYDLRHFIIPWSCSLLLIGLSLLYIFILWQQGASLMGDWTIFAAGPLLALPLFLLSLVSRGQWMGWADSGFELSLGWLLGLSLGGTALMLAVWLGAAVGLLLIAYAHLPKRWSNRGRTMTMQSEIPFAPFLALGAALAYFAHVDIFSNLPIFF